MGIQSPIKQISDALRRHYELCRAEMRPGSIVNCKNGVSNSLWLGPGLVREPTRTFTPNHSLPLVIDHTLSDIFVSAGRRS